MKNNLKKIALVLSIAFILFISLFALDVFEQERWFLALVMHLIPSYILIIITIVSWKKELIGGILWLVTGIFFLIMSPQAWIIYIPAIIISGLNVWSGKKKLVK
jgi:hypothetical protein